MAPHSGATRTAVTPNSDPQSGRPPPQRHMGQLPDHSVPRQAFGSALSAPRVRINDPALQHRLVGLEALTDRGQSQLVKQAEAIKIRGSESRLSHVEVFLIGSVVTPIIERPRPLSAHRHATSHYTLKHEEPL